MAAREEVRSIVWLEPSQCAMVRAAAELAGITIVGAGSDARGQGQTVAAELECAALDDLRSAVARAGTEEKPTRMVFIAAHEGFGAAQEDARAIQSAAQRGVRFASLEPIPGAALELAPVRRGESDAVQSPVRVVPLTRVGKPMREAAEPMRAFGAARTAALESWSGPTEGSLGAALFNAMDLMLSLLGEPETVDAVYVSPARGPGLHALPSDSLTGLHGDLTANLRYADGRGAAIVLSNRASRWNRTLTLLGEGGRLRVFDDGFERLAPDGAKVDELRFRRSSRGAVAGSHAAEALAEGLARVAGDSVDAPSDAMAVLSMGQAALLSARTGQPESPATIRVMIGVA